MKRIDKIGGSVIRSLAGQYSNKVHVICRLAKSALLSLRPIRI